MTGNLIAARFWEDWKSFDTAFYPSCPLGPSPSVVQLVVGEGQMFEPRVQSISGGVSVQTIRSAGRSNAMRARQSLD